MSITISLYLSDPTDAVGISAQFGKLADGTSHVSVVPFQKTIATTAHASLSGRASISKTKGVVVVPGRRLFRGLVAAALLSLCSTLVLPSASQAKTAEEIDASVNAALARFDQDVAGGAKFLAKSKGVLVLPEVVKAAFVFGGQYGEGALRVSGHTQGYYSYGGGSWGASIGIQKKDILIVFLDAAALKQFETSSGWRVGVDATVTLINVGAGTDLSTMQINQPVVGFVVGQKGLMFDVSLNGSKITKINK